MARLIEKHVRVEFVVTDVQVPRRIQERVDRDVESGICIVPGCTTRALHRGVCRACREEARARVGSGEVTEGKLIEKGLILPPGKPGRKPQNAMHEELEKLKS